MIKHLARQLQEPGILVFKDKYESYYYICNSFADYCRAALDMLSSRVESDYFYYDEELDEKDIAKQEAAEYCGAVYKAPVLNKELTRAKAIVAAGDGEAAYEFLYERTDHEYEYMTIARAQEY